MLRLDFGGELQVVKRRTLPDGSVPSGSARNVCPCPILHAECLAKWISPAVCVQTSAVFRVCVVQDGASPLLSSTSRTSSPRVL